MIRRVLMIAPTPFFSDRGCHVRILEEARALQSIDVNVKIITYPNGDSPSDLDVERVGRWTGYTKSEAGPHWFKPILDSMLMIRALSAAMRFRPDIIHAHLHEGCVVGWPAAKIVGAPLLFDYQGGFTKELAHHGAVRSGGFVFKVLSFFESIVDGLADAIMPSSETLGADIRRSKRLRYLQDAVAMDDFSGDLDPEIAKRLNPEGRFPIVFLGLLNRYQGADILLNAIAALKSFSSRKYLFILMGYPDEDKYRRIAEDLGISDSVTFTGRVAYNKAGKMLRIGRIAVAPKIADTESNGKVIDYMACGLPTIAFDTPVNRDLMGDVGVLVPWDGDEDRGAHGLAQAIDSLASDEAKAAELSRRGLDRVRERFSREGLAKRLLEIYEEALDAKE